MIGFGPKDGFSLRYALSLVLAILAPGIFLCFVTTAIAEVNVTYHLDEITSPPPGEFQARILLTGSDSGDLGEPKVLPSAYFTTTFLAKDTSRAAVKSKQNDQIIYSYVFKGRGDLSPGIYKLPEVVLRVGQKENTISWPQVRISQEPAKGLLPFGLEQEVSTTAPYVGEQIVYAVRVTSPPNSRKNDLNVIELSEMWSEEFGNATMQRTQVGDIAVLVGERKRAVFALRPGEFRIPARSVSLELLVPADSVSPVPQMGPRGTNADLAFDPASVLARAKDAPGRLVDTVRRMSTGGFSINVKPLPPKPAGAHGYMPVGEFRFSFSADTSHTVAGENVVAVLELEGDGNLRPWELFPPRSNSGFEIFIGEPKLAVSERQGRLIHKKSFEIVLVPKSVGDLELPVFEIHTFNPRSESFERHANEVSVMHISALSRAGNLPALHESALSAQRALSYSSGQLSGSAIFVILMSPPGLLLLIAVYPLLTAASQPRKLRLLALPRAREMLKGKEHDPALFSQALAIYALAWVGSDKLLALTHQESIDKLRPHCPVTDKTIDDLAAFFRDVERHQFSQGGDISAAPSAERLTELLVRLDDALRAAPRY